ncbi:hypothetical protein GCK32_006282 [Trichostrongylus colubriformis]|uniref:SXP/RAL-2 family protein Ani s 5-like cation-binding domain-containing protein n=1 Tax=Trichostrongylus colubriformis TaxID=6319 RepID=A0AAN8EQS4_TRICO
MKYVILIVAVAGTALCRMPVARYWPLLPQYVYRTNLTAQQEYIDITQNMSLSIAQQKKMLDGWAAKYNVTEEMKEFNTNATKMMNETRNNVTRVISQLSVVLDRKLRIMHNEFLTPLQQQQALGNLSAEFPEAYRVLEWTYSLFTPCDCACGSCSQSGVGRGKGGGHGRRRGRGWDRGDRQSPIPGEVEAIDIWYYNGHSTPSYGVIRYDTDWSRRRGGYYGNGRMRGRHDSRYFSQEFDSNDYDG